CTRDVGSVKLSALAWGCAEVLDVPLLRCRWIRYPQMNVMHLHRSGDRLVFIDLNADAVGSIKVTLPRVISWLPFQSRCFPARNRLIEIPHVKPKVVNDRSDGTTAVVLLAEENVDPRKLDHHDLFPVDDLSTDVRPELLLDLHIVCIQVNVSDRSAFRVRRRELGERWKRNNNGQSHC